MHLVVLDQFAGLVEAHIRAILLIFDDQLDRASGDLIADFVEIHLHADERFFAGLGEAAGQRQDDADLDGGSLSDRRPHGRRQGRKTEKRRCAKDLRLLAWRRKCRSRHIAHSPGIDALKPGVFVPSNLADLEEFDKPVSRRRQSKLAYGFF